MNFKELGNEILEWVLLAEDRDKMRTVVNMVMKLWVP
jgi:hypothetical protein